MRSKFIIYFIVLTIQKKDFFQRVKERWALKYLKNFSISLNAFISAQEKNLSTVQEGAENESECNNNSI